MTSIPYVWFLPYEVKDILSGEQVPADPDTWRPMQ
jgi:histidyl-tRNA synthetase